MDQQISANVMFLDTAKQVWTVLQEMYSMDKNVSRIYQLYENTFM